MEDDYKCCKSTIEWSKHLHTKKKHQVLLLPPVPAQDPAPAQAGAPPAPPAATAARAAAATAGVTAFPPGGSPG